MAGTTALDASVLQQLSCLVLVLQQPLHSRSHDHHTLAASAAVAAGKLAVVRLASRTHTSE